MRIAEKCSFVGLMTVSLHFRLAQKLPTRVSRKSVLEESCTNSDAHASEAQALALLLGW